MALLGLVLAAGLFGDPHPMKNLAPTFVWIAWWVGLSLVVARIGNVWPAFDPWHAVFDTVEALARRATRGRRIARGWTYPRALGVWPPGMLLLGFAWIEIVSSQASVPSRIAGFGLAWPVLTLLPPGMVAFVIAMLATVLFDGAATLLTAARAELAQMLGVLDRLVPAWRPAAGASRVGAGGDRLPPARREDRRLRHPRCAWSRRATTGSRRSTRALGGRQAVPGRRRPAPAGGAASVRRPVSPSATPSRQAASLPLGRIAPLSGVDLLSARVAHDRLHVAQLAATLVCLTARWTGHPSAWTPRGRSLTSPRKLGFRGLLIHSGDNTRGRSRQVKRRRRKGSPAQASPRVAESYAHYEATSPMRPEVGTQPQFRKKKPPQTYRYDSSLSPELSWDGQNGSRELGEWLLTLVERAAALPAPHVFAQPEEFRASNGNVRARVRNLVEAVDQLRRLGRQCA
jgi:hypothetical protein